MYTRYFGLSRSPFSISPDPAFIYLSEKHREALAHLQYVAKNNGFVLLSGEIGSGKTTLIRQFLNELPADVDCALILNPRLTATELFGEILHELTQTEVQDMSRTQLLRALNTHLLDAHARARRVVLIIDEAQNLDLELLEQLRLLTNLETSEHKLLQIILVGQPELRATVQHPDLQQLLQRITADFHLEALSPDEVSHYVDHRLNIADAERALFTRSALKQVAKVSRGVPRLINSICDRALLGAFSEQADKVNKRIVKQASRELLALTAPPSQQTSQRLLLLILACGVLVSGLSGWLFIDYYDFTRQDRIDQPVLASTLKAIETDSAMARSHPLTEPGEPLASTHSTAPATVPVLAPVRTSSPPPSAPNKPSVQVSNRPPGPSSDEHPQALPASSELLDPKSKQRQPTRILVTPSLPARLSRPKHSLPIDTARASVGTTGSAAIAAAPETALDASARPLATTALPQRQANTRFSAIGSLFRSWGHAGGQPQDWPCQRALKLGLRCIRRNTGLSGLLATNRPAIIRLSDTAATRSEPALVIAADATGRLTLSTAHGLTNTLPAELESHWDGIFLAMWKPPQGYKNHFLTPGQNAVWLPAVRKQLSELGIAPPPPADPTLFDPALETTIRHFQIEQKLRVDGWIGRQTLMQLNTLDLSAPLLRTPTEDAETKAAASTAETNLQDRTGTYRAATPPGVTAQALPRLTLQVKPVKPAANLRNRQHGHPDGVTKH